jgi:tetratricopeptide (TPR) repeat protein
LRTRRPARTRWMKWRHGSSRVDRCTSAAAPGTSIVSDGLPVWRAGAQLRRVNPRERGRRRATAGRGASPGPPSARAFALHARLGVFQQALAHCQEAIALHQELDHRWGRAHTWDSLGYVNLNLGDYAEAVACFRIALDLFRSLDDRYYSAETLTLLGDTDHAAGDQDAARRVWQDALSILDHFDHPDADQVRTKLRDLDQPA